MISSIQLAGSNVRIEGFGRDSGPYEKFEQAFQKSFGDDPDIAVREVATPQCPALDFLARIGVGGTRAPRLSLRADAIRSGDVLTGQVASDSPNLHLLIVDDDGKVYDVTERIRPDHLFSMMLKEAVTSRAHSLLVVALASPTPMASVKSASGSQSDAFFHALADETAGLAGIGASVAFFQIE